MKQRPRILCIAGFDPSGGAGILADNRTVEACGGEPLGVLTAITVQNHTAFIQLRWEKTADIIAGIEGIAGLNPQAIKIGICESIRQVHAIVDACKKAFPDAPIVWDPVIKSTSGQAFLNSDLDSPFPKVNLVSPNKEEATFLSLPGAPEYCLIKSEAEHSEGFIDNLYQGTTQVSTWINKRAEGEEKRGTGCILSSAIATYLGQGLEMQNAIQNAQKFLQAYYRTTPFKTGHYFYELH